MYACTPPTLQRPPQTLRRWHEGLQLLHCEGYCLYRPQLAAQMTAAARQHGAVVSMDLASFEVGAAEACGASTLLFPLQLGP